MAFAVLSLFLLLLCLEGTSGQALGAECQLLECDADETTDVCDTNKDPKVCVTQEGKPCTTDDNCALGAKCDDQNKCHCTMPYDVHMNNKICKIADGMVDGKCQTTAPVIACRDSNANCVNGLCQCKDGHPKIEATKTCTNGNGGVADGMVDGKCLTTAPECRDSNANCVNGLCQCKDGHSKIEATKTCTDGVGPLIQNASSIILMLLVTLFFASFNA